VITADISLTDVCEIFDFSDIPFKVKYSDLSNLIFFSSTEGDASLNSGATFDVITSFDDSDNRVTTRMRTLAIESTRATIAYALYTDVNNNLDIFDLSNDLSGPNIYPDNSDSLTQVYTKVNDSGSYNALLLAANEILDICEARRTDVSGIFRPNDILLFNTFVHNGEITVNINSGTGVDGNQSDISFFVPETFGNTSFAGGRVNVELCDQWVDGGDNSSRYPETYNVYTLDRSGTGLVYPGAAGSSEFILRGNGNSAESAGGILVRMAIQVVETLS
jgi:hypothetical protein